PGRRATGGHHDPGAAAWSSSRPGCALGGRSEASYGRVQSRHFGRGQGAVVEAHLIEGAVEPVVATAAQAHRQRHRSADRTRGKRGGVRATEGPLDSVNVEPAAGGGAVAESG